MIGVQLCKLSERGDEYMDDFIINEYKNSRKKPQKGKSHALDKKRKASVLEIFEQSGGLIGPDEISEILEIDKRKVREYLGKTRIKQYETLINGDNLPQKPKRKHRRKQKVDKVDLIVAERNAKIYELSGQGLNLDEVAGKMELSPEYLKEIYLSLGLSIYTDEQLESMRMQGQAVPEKSETIGQVSISTKDQDKKPEESESIGKQEKDKTDHIVSKPKEVSTYQDIGKMLRGFIKVGDIGSTITYGEYFMNNADFLSETERDNLYVLLELIKSKAIYHGSMKTDGEVADEGEAR